jgi:hypothetical protein
VRQPRQRDLHGLVAEEHLRPRAKFPVVDIHNHQGVTTENMDQLISEMDALNLRVLVNYGLAAVFWLIVSGVLSRLIRRLG